MTKTRNRLMLGAAAAAAVAGLGVATPASAAPADVSPSCVASVGGERPFTCFATFEKALAFASGGKLVTGPKNASDALRDPAFHAQVDAANDAADLQVRSGARAATVWTVISIEYDNQSEGDPHIIYSGSSGNCSTGTGNIDYQTSSMPAGWDNRVESFHSYANCWVQHFENLSYGGASTALTGSRSTLGVMNNETSSIRWT
jgi:hypothetical protein